MNKEEQEELHRQLDEWWEQEQRENVCFICGDPYDHYGAPHSLVTGDGKTRVEANEERDQAETIHWSAYTNAQYRAALHASPDATCQQCPHTKYQHFTAGPRCMIEDCQCMAFIVGDSDG